MASRTGERYRNDPAYRELQKKRSKVQYWSKKPIIERMSVEAFKELMQTDLYTYIKIHNPYDLRFGQRVRIPIYRVGTLEQLLRKSKSTIQNWIRNGILPESRIIILSGERPDRGYTYDQVRVLWTLQPLLNFPAREDTHSDWKGHNAFSRYLKHDWDLMPDGVLPQYQL